MLLVLKLFGGYGRVVK